jgi:transcriptional regulator with XRE-family HTH domain
MVKFMNRLKELRTEKGVSQQEIGKLVSMSKMAISHWEKGHSEPSISQLILLAEFFDVTVDYLIGKTDIL